MDYIVERWSFMINLCVYSVDWKCALLVKGVDYEILPLKLELVD